MSIKKKFSIILTISLVVILALSSTMAIYATEFDKNTESDYICIAKNDKIEDLQVLRERAIEQENDAPKEIVKKIEENALLTINGVEQSETPLVTTELLSEYSNGADTIETYAATIISEMDVENNMLRASTTQTISGQVNSTGGEITLYTTLKFVVTTVKGAPAVAFRQVKASAKSNQSSSTIQYVQARYGYDGLNLGTGQWVRKTSSWVKATTGAATVSATGPNLESSADLYRIWGEGLARVKRGADSYWNTTHKIIK